MRRPSGRRTGPEAATLAAALVLATAPATWATDLPPQRPPVAPVPVAAVPIAPPERAIWGAIAFSPATHSSGMFWGGATREEAIATAQTHCFHRDEALGVTSGSFCRPVSVFLNGWVDSTPVRPWPHCGALAVGGAHWGAASSLDQQSASGAALQRCGDATCTIVQDVCT